ncbi:hypothetical protein [Fibrella arboris]|uniref:hypothetical protein n=1 Tax=Fibrella arboris TaxID=3242486 RepID=UPI0035212804
MQPRLTFSLLLIQLSLVQLPARAQGCSDAGFCTIGTLKQHGSADDAYDQTLTLLLPVGIGDESVFVFTPGIQYDRKLSSAWAVQAKLTGNYAQGNLGRATGPGDVFLSGTYSWPTQGRWKTALTIGAKLPLNRGNLTSQNQPLPMQYQSSLGTLDVIGGLSVSSTRWQVSVGWQQPLTGANANTFLAATDRRTEARPYPPSNQFVRRADGLARIAYTLPVGSRLTLNAGLLGIYHVAEDTYTDPNGRNVPIAGSKGLTLNATLAGWWMLSPTMRAGFTAGVPLAVRAVRPDGLTRSVVFAPEISYSF